jgi:hypothetical protein
MSYQPGDEKLARKFTTPRPDMDPRIYEPWMKGVEGEMNRIMFEMLDEMMPLMMPEKPDQEMMDKIRTTVWKKVTPGVQDGEKQGSLMDALKTVMPQMKMMPESMQPGKTPEKMIDAMLKGWQEKYGNMPDVQPMPMGQEPSPPRPLLVKGGAQ